MGTKPGTGESHHGVAHLIAGGRQVDPPEEVPDARLGRAGASRQQDVKVSHKLLHRFIRETLLDASLGEGVQTASGRCYLEGVFDAVS